MKCEHEKCKRETDGLDLCHACWSWMSNHRAADASEIPCGCRSLARSFSSEPLSPSFTTEARELLALCRGFGVTHFKGMDVEFTLSSHSEWQMQPGAPTPVSVKEEPELKAILRTHDFPALADDVDVKELTCLRCHLKFLDLAKWMTPCGSDIGIARCAISGCGNARVGVGFSMCKAHQTGGSGSLRTPPELPSRLCPCGHARYDHTAESCMHGCDPRKCVPHAVGAKVEGG